MLETLQTKYYNFNLIEYLKGCSIDELLLIVNNLKTSKLDKIGLKILGSVLYTLENYDMIERDNTVLLQK